MTLVGSKILHYRILEEIGAGGMGIVYLAEDEKLHRRVALKFVAKAIHEDPNARERLVREARAASRLNHPNIVAMHAIEETPEHIFIVMEYVEGESIRSIVKRGAMTWERALELAPQILSALAMAHEHDVIHRDVKSDNIMLTPKGQLKVLDFGLARGRDTSAFVSRMGSSAGTPAYMSPEQVRDGEVDHRSDLFSFGVVLYEMVTGRMPFKGEHEAAVTYSIVNESPTAARVHNKAVPDALQTVITKLLEKHPRDRYQSAAEVIADLERAGAGRGIPGRARRPRRALVAVAAVVAVVAMAAWFVRGRGPGGALVPEASAGRKMLAVLPFENLGPTDQEYFADGVTEEITTHLAKLSGLGVISRTSAMKYKDTEKSLRQVGKELGVEYVLEGSVRWDKSGGHNSVRVSTQLIRIHDDTHLWAENFDRVYEEIFALQSEIASKVAEELNVTLLAPERAAIAAAPTRNLDAYDLYMRGRAGYDRALGLGEMEEAIALVEQAVALDSTFAEAQAFLARRYANQYFNGLHPERPLLEKARRASLVAMRHSNDQQPAGHVAVGYYHYYGSRDYERALREFDLARRLQPNNAEVIEAIAFVQRRQGRWEESVANLERAIELDPSNSDRIGNLLQTLVYMRRWDDARRYVARGLALEPGGQFDAYRALMRLVESGDIAGARAILDPLLTRHFYFRTFMVECDIMARDYAAVEQHMPGLKSVAGIDTATYYLTRGAAYHFADDDRRARIYADSAFAFMNVRNFATSDNPNKLASYATALGMLDRNAEALRTIDRAVDIMPVERDAMTGADLRNERAIIYIITGEYDRAIRELEYLMSVPSGFSPAILRLHPGFDSLRDDPRFRRLIEEKVSS
ncbi:MAG TPA: protein kinase [Candidatus Krumholzibacteria bacterium]|nr:protein kinase [Candidatus Krumholzibacteria bacterium]